MSFIWKIKNICNKNWVENKFEFVNTKLGPMNEWPNSTLKIFVENSTLTALLFGVTSSYKKLIK